MRGSSLSLSQTNSTLVFVHQSPARPEAFQKSALEQINSQWVIKFVSVETNGRPQSSTLTRVISLLIQSAVL